MSQFVNRDGALSEYALRCGYIDVVRSGMLADGTSFEIRLSHNGATYDLDLSWGDALYIERVELPGGALIAPGWLQTDSLTEARKFARQLARMETRKEQIEFCVKGMTL